jgi:outer membrane biosynthesis protein TonB
MKKKSKSSKSVWFISGGIALVILCFATFVVKLLISDDGQKQRRQIQMVTVTQPPPPPKMKEEPPPPEVKKEEVVQEVQETPQEEMDDSASDEPPPGEDLGLDADGVAGFDAFGLKAKKGGRGLIGSGGGDGNKYAWYTRIIKREIQEKVNEIVRKNGGVPDGSVKTLIRIELNDMGHIVDFDIIGFSGDKGVDTAVKKALELARIGERPPIGMSKKMRFRITT